MISVKDRSKFERMIVWDIEGEEYTNIVIAKIDNGGCIVVQEFYEDEFLSGSDNFECDYYQNYKPILRKIKTGEDALEWARMTLESRHTLPGESYNKYRAYLVLSQALVSHGKMEEAKKCLAEAKGLALKVGRDYSMAGFYYATGIFEKAQGNYEDAKFQLLEALKIYENQPRQNSVNLCIHRLADLEVDTYQHEQADLFDLSESWFAKLEQISRDNDYPGFLGLALLHKCRLYIKQGNLNEANELLNEVLKISQNPGTKFLRRIIEDKFEDIKIDVRSS